MKYAIFFAGSGQKANDPSLIYTTWAERLHSHGFATQLFDGVGEFGKTKRWWGGSTSDTNALTGAGWAKIVGRAMWWLAEEVRVGNTLDKVVVVGMSRGGVQAVVCANCLHKRYPNLKEVFVFAVDPVQGWTAINKGSFDMRADRPGTGGSRDALKAEYGLGDDAPNCLLDNVRFYLSVIMQFKGKNRWSPGFTPQSPTLQNMTVKRGAKVYELPGNHSTGVASGLQSDGSAHVHQGSRTRRSDVTTDMFYHHLREEGFGDVGQLDDFMVFDHYCRIANEDLAGYQFDAKKSGFSFLMASHPGSGRRFEADPSSRFHRGRGHLVQSTQVKVISPDKGYFVNERHFDLYRAVDARLRIKLRNNPDDPALAPIRKWMEYNERDFRPSSG